MLRSRLAAGLAALALACLPCAAAEARDTTGLLVLGSDFGLGDGAVAAMKGTALGVGRGLVLHDLTHEIPPFDVWYGAYQLALAMPYWPKGTVFLVVVDPGAAAGRGAVVARTRSGQFFVGPDNGLLTLVAEKIGIEEVHRIDDEKAGAATGESAAPGVRDHLALTAARLASGDLELTAVGPALPGDVVRLPYPKASLEGGVASGMVAALEVTFGNVWTNIDRGLFERLGIAPGQPVAVKVLRQGEVVFEGEVPFALSFSDVPDGEPLAYLNGDGNLALAVRYGNFAEDYGVEAGTEWRVELAKP
jgi:S-adenosylmethionine hydrolase